LPESGQAFGGGVFVAGTYFDTQTDAQVGNEITVIDVAGTSGFYGIAAAFPVL
jgi:ribosomal protein L11 methylase PrmA